MTTGKDSKVTFALSQPFSLMTAALKSRKITGYQPVSELSLASQEEV